MSIGEVIVYLVVALVCSLVGQAIAGRSLGGLIVSTVVGLIGAMLGGLIARSISAPEPFLITVGDRTIPMLWTVIGAALVTGLVCLFTRRGAAATV
jgi:uncharacterized membrane protein YeaQ/YmgE (transglycosylase-associated protein family)